jgi:hypothetical protein
MEPAMSRPVPLRKRPGDWVLLGFFWFNLLVITYTFDLEQVVIADVNHFSYPLWPPGFIIDLAHWWGRQFDPLLAARPVWWKATIWIDLLCFGPFYAAAIYAFTKGKEWIRVPAILWAAVMMTNVTIILSEEAFGPFASPALAAVVAANASWLLFPILVIIRVTRRPQLFAPAATTSSGAAAALRG